MRYLSALRAVVGAVLFSAAAQSYAAPCLIFVHGKQTDTNTYTSYSAARNYWVNGSDDFIKTATKNFTADYYVCLLYTSPSPRDGLLSRMPSSA